MSQPLAITPAFLDCILTLLEPLFLPATAGDSEAARATVRETLGFGALDALGKAANKDLSLDEVMDLRDSATALSTAADKSQVALDRLQKQRPARVQPATLPDSMEGRDLVTFARSGEAAATRESGDSSRGRTTMH
jgi:hypothetical protein